jgi:integrase
LLQNGAPITYVQGQLGHTSAGTTLRFYAKYVPDQHQRFVDLLDAKESREKPAVNTAEN